MVYLPEKWVDNLPTWMLAQARGWQACEWKGKQLGSWPLVGGGCLDSG